MINNIIYRYIIKGTYLYILYVMLSLIALNFVIKTTEQLSSLNDQYNLLKAVIFSFLYSLGEIDEFLPVTVLIGSITFLGILYTRHELTIIQSIGISKLKIGLSIFIFVALPISIINIFNNQYISPKLKNIANNIKISSNSYYGVWEKNNNQFLYISNINSFNQALGIYIYEYEGNKLIRTINAKVGNWDEGKKGWNLENVIKKDITPNKIKVSNEALMLWTTNISSDKLRIGKLNPNNLSIIQLVSYINEMKHYGRDTNSFELSLWKKIFSPIVLAVIILLSMSLVFGSLRNSSTIIRIMLGIIIGIIFYILNLTISPIASLYKIPTFISYLIPSIIFAIVSFILFRINKN